MGEHTSGKMPAKSEISKLFASLAGSEFIKRFMTHYKTGNISTDSIGALDLTVTLFFFLGALTFAATSSMFNRISRSHASNNFVKYMKVGNKYLFMVLSFMPGLYYAFKYEHFILKLYLVTYFISSGYFLYKRYRDFEIEPFVIGLGMSAALYFLGPFIHGFFSIFGTGWFATSCASFVENVLNLALAVAFLLDLPRKYLPANMLFGLKFVKFFMYFLSWQTWFILMVFASWKNVGAAARAFFDVNDSKRNVTQKVNERK